MKRSLLLDMFRCIMAADEGGIFEAKERVRRENERNRQRKQARAEAIGKMKLQQEESRQLKTFNIKGHTIEAYSRKDAIIKLKHQGKL